MVEGDLTSSGEGVVPFLRLSPFRAVPCGRWGSVFPAGVPLHRPFAFLNRRLASRGLLDFAILFFFPIRRDPFLVEPDDGFSA